MTTLVWKELPQDIKDTSRTQLQSLARFAEKECGAFYNVSGSCFYLGQNKVRFNTMVKWHNASESIENKIIEKVKMQRQKDGTVLVQNHLVKFLKPVYKMVFFDRDFHLNI